MQRFLRKTPRSLDYGVMVAQQVLVLFVQVRILVVQQPIKERGCVKMMHPLFRYRTIGFSFFIEYDWVNVKTGQRKNLRDLLFRHKF